MATTILGKVSITPKGIYNPLTAYAPLDLITHEGNGYIVRKAVTGITPTDGEYYLLLSTKGQKGDTGNTGEKGDTGRGIDTIERTAGDGAAGSLDTYTITYTDGSSSQITVQNGRNGINGTDGTDGTDGFSPTVATAPTEGGTTVTITDKGGEKVFTITNGRDGAKGEKGEKGKDFTILGYYETIEALKEAVQAPNPGDVYGVGTAAPYDIYVYDGVGADWKNNGRLQGAKGEQGEKGADGISPTVATSSIDGGTKVTITDSTGTKEFDVLNGQKGADGAAGEKGADGVSPTVATSPIEGGTKVTITDSEGAKEFDVLNGQKGADGAAGEKGADGISPTVATSSIEGGTKVTITDSTGAKEFDVLNGQKGADGAAGEKGADGISPTVATSSIEGGTKVTITDAGGAKEFDVLNGQKGAKGEQGEKGADGKTPVKGTDYFTEAEKEEIAGEAAKKAKGKRMCRFVVGTSTAGWTEADCDYLCDGTDDQVEINQAIQALPSTGGEIRILDGSYNITNEILVNKENVKISGNGNSTVLNRKWSANNTGVIAISKSYTIVSDLKIDGNKEQFTEGSGIILEVQNLTNIKIINNTCNNNNNGINADSSQDITVTGNTCNNNNNGINACYSQNSTVTGNTCNNNNNGINADSSQDITVTGNACNNNNNGISDSNTKNITVTGNICNNNKYGICANFAKNITVTGNVCNNNNNNGIYVYKSQNSTVTGNTCTRGTGQSSDYTAEQYTIRVIDVTKCVIVGNNCAGKAPTVSGTGNIVANNVG